MFEPTTVATALVLPAMPWLKLEEMEISIALKEYPHVTDTVQSLRLGLLGSYRARHGVLLPKGKLCADTCILPDACLIDSSLEVVEKLEVEGQLR